MSRLHGRAIEATPGITLSALADINEEALGRMAAELGVSSLFHSYHEMYERAELDVVVISTHAPIHAPAVIAAAQAGVRGILCEKPLAMDLAEADEMIGACRQAGAVLAVNHQQQLDPHVQEARRLLDSGAIGRLKHVSIYDKEGRPAGNSLMEMAVHLFNLARFLLGPPRWVSAYAAVAQRPAGLEEIKHSQEANPGDRDCGLVLGEQIHASFGFDGGVVASFRSLGGEVSDASLCGLDLLGSEGCLVLRGSLPPKLYRLNTVDWTPDQPLERVLLEDESAPVARGIGRMMEAMVRAVNEGSQHPVSGEAGRTTLEMVMGIYASHRLGGRRVALPLEDRRHPLQAWRQEPRG